jgi:hypothetical protein
MLWESIRERAEAVLEMRGQLGGVSRLCPAKISFPSCLNAFVPLCVGLRATRAPYYNPRESSRPAKISFPSCLNAFVPLCVGLRATRGVAVSWAFHVKIERRFLNSPGLAFLVRKAEGGQDKREVADGSGAMQRIA